MRDPELAEGQLQAAGHLGVVHPRSHHGADPGPVKQVQADGHGQRDQPRQGERVERGQPVAVLLLQRFKLFPKLIDILAQRLRAVLLDATGPVQSLATRWRRGDQTKAEHRRNDRRKETSPPRRHKTSSWNGNSHSKGAR